MNLLKKKNLQMNYLIKEKSITKYFSPGFADVMKQIFSKEKLSFDPLEKYYWKYLFLNVFFENNILVKYYLAGLDLMDISSEERDILKKDLFLFSCIIITKQNDGMIAKTHAESLPQKAEINGNITKELKQSKYKLRMAETFLLAKLFDINYEEFYEPIYVAYISNNINSTIQLCMLYQSSDINVPEILMPFLLDSLKQYPEKTFDKDFEKTFGATFGEIFDERVISYEFDIYLVAVFFEPKHISKIKKYIPNFNFIKNSKNSLYESYSMENFSSLAYIAENFQNVKKNISSIVKFITAKKVKKSHRALHFKFLDYCSKNKRKKMSEMIRNNEACLSDNNFFPIIITFKNGFINDAFEMVTYMAKEKNLDENTIIKIMSDKHYISNGFKIVNVDE